MGARRLLAGVVVLLCVAVGACGNSKSQNSSPTTSPLSNSPLTTASAADLTKNVPRPDVHGVTDTTIRVAVITAKTNPIGGRYHEFIDGIKPYFKVINDKGGIYGRKLVVVSNRDDVVGLQNVQQTTSSLADDNAFATFDATQQLTGAELLVKAHMPTFIRNIDPEMASTATFDHSNIFGTNPAICFNCPGPLNAWLAEQNGFTKVGILAYGVSAESTRARGLTSQFRACWTASMAKLRPRERRALFAHMRAGPWRAGLAAIAPTFSDQCNGRAVLARAVRTSYWRIARRKRGTRREGSSEMRSNAAVDPAMLSGGIECPISSTLATTPAHSPKKTPASTPIPAPIATRAPAGTPDVRTTYVDEQSEERRRGRNDDRHPGHDPTHEVSLR